MTAQASMHVILPENLLGSEKTIWFRREDWVPWRTRQARKKGHQNNGGLIQFWTEKQQQLVAVQIHIYPLLITFISSSSFLSPSFPLALIHHVQRWSG